VSDIPLPPELYPGAESTIFGTTQQNQQSPQKEKIINQGLSTICNEKQNSQQIQRFQSRSKRIHNGKQKRRDAPEAEYDSQLQVRAV